MGEARRVIREYLVKAHKTFKEKIPEAQEAFMRLYEVATRDGALSRKFKELIMLAESVVMRCEPCIAVHMKKALEAGATEEEIMEVLATCLVMGGGPCLGYCGYAVRCYEEFAKR